MIKTNPLILHYPFETNDNPSDWKQVGEWTGMSGSYSALAEATSNASVKDLVKYISGNKDDWTVLRSNEKVSKGDKINIAPLLLKIEEQIRNNIVANTPKLNTGFPQFAEEIALMGATTSINDINEAKEIRKYFSRKRYGFRDCNTSAIIIFAKSILDVLGNKTFNALGYSATSVPIIGAENKSLTDTKKGDWVFFANYDDYNDKMTSIKSLLNKVAGKDVVPPYYGENAIVFGSDQFYGLPAEGAKTYAQWLDILRDAYNKPQGTPIGNQITNLPPGFDKIINFPDVAQIASATFRYRCRCVEVRI
jgi:hypothetical protein